MQLQARREIFESATLVVEEESGKVGLELEGIDVWEVDPVVLICL